MCILSYINWYTKFILKKKKKKFVYKVNIHMEFKKKLIYTCHVNFDMLKVKITCVIELLFAWSVVELH